MTSRRLPAMRPMGATSYERAEEPRPACEGIAKPGKPTPYDLLHDYISGPKYERAKTEARALCSQCPIALTCLDENRYTAWGRAVIGSRRMGRPATSPCGSLAAYTRHLKNSQTPCDACKGAYADYRRKYRAKKRGQEGEAA